MNFPISTEKLKRLLCQTQRNNGGSGHQSGSETGGEPAEPPSSLAFKNIQPDLLGNLVNVLSILRVVVDPVLDGGKL